MPFQNPLKDPAGVTVNVEPTPVTVEPTPVTVVPNDLTLTRFWPCKTGETDAPTLSGSPLPSYMLTYGMSSLQLRPGSSKAAWSALHRYGPEGQTTLTVGFYAWWRYFMQSPEIGFNGGKARFVNSSGIRLSAAGGGTITLPNLERWVYVELVYTPTETRLRIDRDDTKVTTGAAVADSSIAAGFEASYSSGSGDDLKVSSILARYS